MTCLRFFSAIVCASLFGFLRLCFYDRAAKELCEFGVEWLVTFGLFLFSRQMGFVQAACGGAGCIAVLLAD